MSDVKTEIILHGDGRLIVNRVQDVEPILEANKKEYNSVSTKGKKFKGDFHKVATIPNVMVEKFMKMGINLMRPTKEDMVRLKKILNDPDYKHLRTTPGWM